MNLKKMATEENELQALCPPGARTADSAVLWWEPSRAAANAAEYAIFADGREVGRSKATDFTVTALAADRQYDFHVRALDSAGKIIAESSGVSVRTRRRGKRLDLTAFGAIGDGVTVNTKAFRNAIEACPADGEVYVPAGVFVSGAIFLKNDMTLYLEKDAVVRGADSLDEYPMLNVRFEGRRQTCFASLVNGSSYDGEELRDVVIAGKGRLDGNGEILLAKEKEARDSHSRGRTLCIHHGRDIYLNGVTIGNSPAWCTHLVFCRGVTINGVTINSRFDPETGRDYKVHNGDGCNPDSCTDVYIFNSTVISQDDNIAVKSGMNEEGRAVGRPSERIRITNCRLQRGLGIACGSDMSGGVRDVRVRDCEFTDCAQVGQIKTPRGRGGIVEDVRFSDIRYEHATHSYGRWFRAAICLDAYYGEKEPDVKAVMPVNESTPQVRNVSFENITIINRTGPGILVQGLPEAPYENIRFKNIFLRSAGEPVKVLNAEGVIFENVVCGTIENKESGRPTSG